MDVKNLNEDQRALMNGIYARIKNKQENDGWLKSRVLQEEFNISGPEVRKCIHAMRTAKFPIISGAKGYKFARSEDEIRECIGNLYSRVRSIAEAARGLVGARDKHYSGQASIEFEMVDQILETAKILENETHLFGHRRSDQYDPNDGAQKQAG